MAVAVLPTPRVASSTLQVWILSPDSVGRRIRYIVVTFFRFSWTAVFDGVVVLHRCLNPTAVAALLAPCRTPSTLQISDPRRYV